MAQLETLLRIDSFSSSRHSHALSVANGSLTTRHFPNNPIDVLSSTPFNVPEQSKEAYAFALLAYETFHHRPSNLPSATGATRPAILGKICYA
jgi:1,6-anhydro-N-acetylmuramate kinase